MIEPFLQISISEQTQSEKTRPVWNRDQRAFDSVVKPSEQDDGQNSREDLKYVGLFRRFRQWF